MRTSAVACTVLQSAKDCLQFIFVQQLCAVMDSMEAQHKLQVHVRACGAGTAQGFVERVL
jgi:hypothetical protein